MEIKVNKEYETKRLRLELVNEDLCKKILDYYCRNAEFFECFETKKNKDFYTLEIQKKRIKEDMLLQEMDRTYRFWILEKDNDDKVIGTIAISSIVRGAFQSCFLGYKLDKDFINKGYMTEAVNKVLEIAFEDLKLHRVEANIIPRNLASIKVVQKCGFEKEGSSKKYLNVNGIWEDHHHFVKINDNFDLKDLI